ncbi:MAG: transcription-repair coupling factor [Candidatus Eisenbacteria bacterium]|uniref:Transcription-repair-coupling factor n=1 Tax=Eiseniibacteriota bacterium TaxID=2212470 RepID=A0A538T0D6_UNCEI|nr:MAG: transcription-repair coupling factor [Candidatus Eisenbacteria bacterium]
MIQTASSLAEQLLRAAERHPGFDALRSRVAGDAAAVPVRGVAGSAGALLLAGLTRSLPRPFAVIAPDLDRAEAWRDDLEFLLGPDRVVYLPPHDVVPWSSQVATGPVRDDRITAMLRLGDPHPPVAVIPAVSLYRLAPSPASIRARAITLAAGVEIAPEVLARGLVLGGYRSVNEVGEVGEVSRRGGLLDVFAPGMPYPVRIEFDGDAVASLRTFDVSTQRSVAPVESTRIASAREILFTEDLEERLKPLERGRLAGDLEGGRIRDLVTEGVYFEGVDWLAPHLGIPLGSLLEYLAPGTAIWMDEPEAAGRELESAEREAERLEADARRRAPHLPEREELFDPPERSIARLAGFHRIESRVTGGPAERDPVISFDARPQPSFGRKLDLLRGELRRLAELGYERVIVCDNRGQAERLEEILGDGVVSVDVGSITAGFVLPPARIAVFTDHEIFARYRRRRGRRSGPSRASIRDLMTLEPGQYVVHLDHGIGIYRGLKRITLDGQDTECIHIEYAQNDRLFVPIDQLGMVQRYSAEEGRTPLISRLGGTAWQRTKAKARRAIREMAEELLRNYAVRKARDGRAFSPDTPWQRELESSFPYEETPDQLRTVEEVKRDMESPRAMDRLVCGDVGYGKTEVAIRAAFKAVQDGTQVAVLVPTTVLAQQHLVTFTERFADFPVRIDMLSRFRSPREQKQIVEKIRRGEVDIVIGTHRLLSKDVQFKSLGLAVIDEEQRFGVAQKERIRTFVENVDVLTLTATPIPRTLHMSLLGARDMSVMNTPPRGRYPIKTEIVEMSKDVIRDGLLREADRGGQSFFVHNRVESIDRVAHYLRSVAPQLRYGVAHGQMRDVDLERVMLDFLERRTDVLVTTLIIESGLDIPSVNTMLMNRADTLGLAQIYQLRGRIGRSHHQAFCYLLVPAGTVLSEEAEKRLRVIAEHEELGAGLTIAMRDLEIRGAGNLLGPEQHGFMISVGFDLYCRMVDEVVQELQGKAPERRPEPSITSDLPAFIPEEYIADPDEKLDAYRRMAAVTEPGELEEIRAEFRDRFGPLPPEAEHLLELKGLRLIGREAGATRLRVGRDRLEVDLADALRREQILRLVASTPARIEFAGGGTGSFRVRTPAEPISLATNLLRVLVGSDSVTNLPLPAAGS